MNRNASLSSSVLDRIVAAKRREVEALRPRRGELVAGAAAAPAPPSFRAALECGAHVALIAEVKRRSPSAGGLAVVPGPAGACATAQRYTAAGAAAVSVLTDEEWFGGSVEDLRAVVAGVAVPVLRKDFVIDEVQIVEARAAGAAAVLLIVRILGAAELRGFLRVAGGLGLDALVEVHDDAELERALEAGAEVIGVNNRDLATFTTDLETTERLASRVPPGRVLVAESGIRGIEDVERVAAAGVHAVLVGETLMRSADPVAAARALACVRRVV